MALPPGTSIGPYEVLGVLGAGGMGEVHRAHDRRLGRDVALKLLPPPFSHDADRLARFGREAQVLAALNHPNIAAIYGIEDAGETTALVLELVEGATLAERIARGPIAADDALPIARQIVDALDAAHAHGIVHRDLKPANIIVRADGAVKVLDFGLAKLADPSGGVGASAAHAASAPTVTSPAMTSTGMILGTAAYMAPEQARGRPVDKRADIWAFGCVLYEMLTGLRTFDGEDVSVTLANVIKADPDWTALPDDTSSSVRRLLRRCLTKDPGRRLSDIGDARLEIEDANADVRDRETADASDERGRSSRSPWLSRAGWTLAGALLTTAVVWPWIGREPGAAPGSGLPAFRVSVAAPRGVHFEAGHALSPDGRLLAFRASRAGENVRLWIRALDTMEEREVPDSDGVLAIFWTPDSRALAFSDPNSVKRFDLATNIVQRIVSHSAESGAWSTDGTLLVSAPATPGASDVALWLIAPGGERRRVASLAPSETELSVGQFLPGNERFLFTATPGQRVFIGSVHGPERTPVIENARNVWFAAGHLFFLRQTNVMVQPFDVERGAVTGDPTLLIPQVSAAFTMGARGNFSVSTNGVVSYRPSGASHLGGTLVWVDGRGGEAPLPSLAREGGVWYPQLSPDARRLAFVTDGDIWVADLSGRPPIRVTFGGPALPAASPLWTRDGSGLVFEGRGALMLTRSDGSANAPTLVSPTGHYHAHGWSGDGRQLIAVKMEGPNSDIVAIPFGEDGEPQAIVATPAAEGVGGTSVSPDGRWLAYWADPTGRAEIWVRPLSGPGAAVRVSADGGSEPIWSRDGRRLFYRAGADVWTTDVDPTSVDFSFTPPVLLFSGNYVRGEFLQPPNYDVAPDGRFLMLKWLDGGDPGELPLMVLTNWMAELERAAP